MSLSRAGNQKLELHSTSVPSEQAFVVYISIFNNEMHFDTTLRGYIPKKLVRHWAACFSGCITV